MPIKNQIETLQFIESVPLPVYEGDSYTVISHGSIIGDIKRNLEKNNLEVTNEIYSPAQNGNIVTGVIQVGSPQDGLSFNISFLNSYNKAKRFVVVGGSKVVVCQNGHVLGMSELGQYKRTHTGTADIDAKKYIEIICNNATNEFDLLSNQMNLMKNVDLNKKDIHHLISELYFQEELIKDTQMSIIKKELSNPSFDYGTPENNLWTAYNAVTYGLKSSHPKDYIEMHQKVNKYVTEQFSLFESRDIDYPIESPFSLMESIY